MFGFKNPIDFPRPFENLQAIGINFQDWQLRLELGVHRTFYLKKDKNSKI